MITATSHLEGRWRPRIDSTFADWGYISIRKVSADQYIVDWENTPGYFLVRQKPLPMELSRVLSMIRDGDLVRGYPIRVALPEGV